MKGRMDEWIEFKVFNFETNICGEQISGFSILYPVFNNLKISFPDIPGYGAPPAQQNQGTKLLKNLSMILERFNN